MSNGEESEHDPDETASPERFEESLAAVEDDLEDASTESALDEVEATVEEIADELESVTLADDDRDALDDRIDDLRDGIEEKRGPYAEDVTSELTSAETTITSSEWTDAGKQSVSESVQTFVESAGATLSESFTLDSDDIASTVSAVSGAIETAELDADEDAETITTLLDAAEKLTAELEDAEVIGDLEVREQLEVQGFYDVLEPGNRRDFPPEWNAIKLYEARGEVEPILLAMETLDSDFMEENILDALEHMAPVEAYDQVAALAKRRDTHAVRVLGRIGDDRACGTLENFLGKGDVALRKTSLWALGCIGNTDSTEAVAQELAADSPVVRSAAARALGLLGDTRAIDPLADRLADDETESVRASAAWALNQIGTARALDALSSYADDRSYLVQAEARKATGV